MEKQPAVIDTSFWVLGHRTDVLAYTLRFFTLFIPDAVRQEILESDPRYPKRVYGYQELFSVFETQGLLTAYNPSHVLSHFHAGEAAAIALSEEKSWWLLINEQRPLTYARRQRLKAVTLPEFIVYLYEYQLLSYRSASDKLDILASNTGRQVMTMAEQALQILASDRREGDTYE